MSVPKYYEFHKPMLQCVADGKAHTLKEIKTYLIHHFHLTGDDLSELLPSGRQTYFANRVGWARTYLKKAGLLETATKGSVSITEAGKSALLEDPAVIDRSYLMKYPAFREFVRTSPKGQERQVTVGDETQTPDDALEEAFREINQSLVDDILTEVMKLSPIAFEKFVLDLMAKMGYGTFATTTAFTGDEGIDGIIMEDKLGFDLIYVQVKHWAPDHLVGRPDVQAFVGAIAGKGGKGLFVTTSHFTKQALEYAKNQHIILMDGEKLAYSMIECNFGVSVKKTFEIKGLDSDLFADYQDD